MTANQTEIGKTSERVIVLLDLDNNVFQSARHLSSSGVTKAVAYKTTGEPCGFMTPAQETLFNWLNNTALIIPNTARDTATFRRVQLPFKSYSICSFGGVILQPDGNVEPTWHRVISDRASSVKASIEEVYEHLLQIATARSFNIRARLVKDQDLTLYISVKHNDHLNFELVELGKAAQDLLPRDWTVHFNDNNLAIFPQFLGKEKACTWLLENLIRPPEETVVIGSGDSFTDVLFMSQSHFALIPAKSQNFLALGHVAAIPNSNFISR